MISIAKPACACLRSHSILKGQHPIPSDRPPDSSNGYGMPEEVRVTALYDTLCTPQGRVTEEVEFTRVRERFMGSVRHVTMRGFALGQYRKVLR
jgi:hypothetical protein